MQPGSGASTQMTYVMTGALAWQGSKRLGMMRKIFVLCRWLMQRPFWIRLVWFTPMRKTQSQVACFCLLLGHASLAPADEVLVDIPMPSAQYELPDELQNLPPIPTLNAIAPANPVLPEDAPDRLSWFKRLKNRVLGRNDFETEPTIRVQVEGAPEPLAHNVQVSLQRITVEEFRDFRDILPRLRTLAREAGQAMGYYEPQFRFVPLSTSRLRVEVIPGEPVTVQSQNIRVEGEGQQDESFIHIQEQPDLKVGDVFRHDTYEQTKLRLASLRTEKGYFDGHWVERDVQVTLPDNTADIRLHYDSGARYRLGEIRFENVTGTGDPLPVRAELIDQLNPLQAGQPFDATQIAQLSRNLLDTRWFNNIEVRTIVPDPVDTLRVSTVQASDAAGRAQDKLDQATEARQRPAVEGQLTDGEPNAEQSQMDPVPLINPQADAGVSGEATEGTELSEEVRRTRALQAEVRATREVPVTVVLDARYPNAAEVGLGYGTDTEFRVRGQYRRALINDRGHSAEANLELSKIRQAIEARYLMPYKHPLNDTLTFVGGYERENRLPNFDKSLDLLVQSLTFGVERSLRTPQSRSWERTWSLRYQLDQLDINWDKADDSLDPSQLPPPFNIGYDIPRQQSLLLGFGLNKVRKEGGIDPVQAWRQYYQVQVGSKALLTDVDLAILRAGARRIYSFGEDWQHQLVGRVDGGMIITQNFDEMPYNLRFFAGGDQSIRGYDYKSLSHMEYGYQVGGQNLAVGSVEYNYRFRPSLRAAVFVDAGNAFDGSWQGEVKVGLGLGVRWSSPIGPVRLDVAAGVSETRVPIRLHFFIGPAL